MIIKIFTVTKNEYDLIEDWTNYYGNIFGYDNLTIIDTGSDNQYVLNYYIDAKKKGVNIIFDNGYLENQQGEKFTKYMLIEKKKDKSDFLLGCDTDNFIFIKNSKFINKNEIINFFCNLPKEINKFKIHSSVDSLININSENYVNNKYNRPVFDTDAFIYQATICLNFYRTKNFISTSNGNHIGKTEPDQNPYVITEASFFHFNHTGIKRTEERCLTICNGYEYFNINYPHNYLNSKKNYDIIRDVFFKNKITCGIHRYIQLVSIILRYYIFFLFEKYATDEYYNINTFYNFLYYNYFLHVNSSDENIICKSFSDEILNSHKANIDFIKFKLEYDSNYIENQFINFFDSSFKVKKQNFTIKDIFNTDESNLYNYFSNTFKKYENGNIIKIFLDESLNNI